jgi:hypothetical protein
MPKSILALIGLAYAALAAWCALQPESTSQQVGLQRLGSQGRSEYLTVYGGLQVGLALLFLLPLVKPDMLRPMILASVLVHASLVVFRTSAFLTDSGFPSITYKLAAVEWAVLAVSLGLWWWTE